MIEGSGRQAGDRGGMVPPSLKRILLMILMIALGGGVSMTGIPSDSSASQNNDDVTQDQEFLAQRDSVIYTVKPNDTLSIVAARYGISIPALKRANPDAARDPLQLKIGQTLLLPLATP
jgi:LysM repeat protein